MYKVITSLWSKPIVSNRPSLPSDSSTNNDDDNWVFVADTGSSTLPSNHPIMTNSWIASPPLLKTDEPSAEVQHLNPLENLLIEHASMSVYEQIPSKPRHRRPRNLLDHTTVDEEEASTNEHDPSVTSTHSRLTNFSLESSTSSLTAHYRHLHRLQQQRRKRSKLLGSTNADQFKQAVCENLDRPRLNRSRSPKLLLPEHSRGTQ